MKKFSLCFTLIALVLCLLQGCVKDTLQTTYTYYSPVYKSKTEVWQGIRSAAPRPLQQTGKLFLYGRYIFINELNRGVHIIDNANPQSPKNLAFIAIPGNVDIAVQNNALYADLSTDMITIDIANPANAMLKKVNTRVFPEQDFVNGLSTDTTRYVVDWVKHETRDKRELDSNKSIVPPVMWYTAPPVNAAAGAAITGISGSMARFTIVNNYLYTVGRSLLTPFNISVPADPIMGSAQSLGWNIETIYPVKDKLFIGSQTGMFIYSIADPAKPTYVGGFSHACFRDPVIADDHYAFITLRSTNQSACWGGTAVQRNELDIVNITDILQPALVKVYSMTEPRGLSKDGDNLFVCDGAGGLKIFNAADVLHIRQIKVINDINPFDIICRNGLAIVVAAEGVYQYDYANINDIRLISKIAINK